MSRSWKRRVALFGGGHTNPDEFKPFRMKVHDISGGDVNPIQVSDSEPSQDAPVESPSPVRPIVTEDGDFGYELKVPGENPVYYFPPSNYGAARSWFYTDPSDPLYPADVHETTSTWRPDFNSKMLVGHDSVLSALSTNEPGPLRFLIDHDMNNTSSRGFPGRSTTDWACHVRAHVHFALTPDSTPLETPYVYLPVAPSDDPTSEKNDAQVRELDGYKLVGCMIELQSLETSSDESMRRVHVFASRPQLDGFRRIQGIMSGLVHTFDNMDPSVVKYRIQGALYVKTAMPASLEGFSNDTLQVLDEYDWTMHQSAQSLVGPRARARARLHTMWKNHLETLAAPRDIGLQVVEALRGADSKTKARVQFFLAAPSILSGPVPKHNASTFATVPTLMTLRTLRTFKDTSDDDGTLEKLQNEGLPVNAELKNYTAQLVAAHKSKPGPDGSSSVVPINAFQGGADPDNLNDIIQKINSLNYVAGVVLRELKKNNVYEIKVPEIPKYQDPKHKHESDPPSSKTKRSHKLRNMRIASVGLHLAVFAAQLYIPENTSGWSKAGLSLTQHAANFASVAVYGSSAVNRAYGGTLALDGALWAVNSIVQGTPANVVYPSVQMAENIVWNIGNAPFDVLESGREYVNWLYGNSTVVDGADGGEVVEGADGGEGGIPTAQATQKQLLQQVANLNNEIKDLEKDLNSTVEKANENADTANHNKKVVQDAKEIMLSQTQDIDKLRKQLAQLKKKLRQKRAGNDGSNQGGGPGVNDELREEGYVSGNMTVCDVTGLDPEQIGTCTQYGMTYPANATQSPFTYVNGQINSDLITINVTAVEPDKKDNEQNIADFSRTLFYGKAVYVGAITPYNQYLTELKSIVQDDNLKEFIGEILNQTTFECATHIQAAQDIIDNLGTMQDFNATIVKNKLASINNVYSYAEEIVPHIMVRDAFMKCADKDVIYAQISNAIARDLTMFQWSDLEHQKVFDPVIQDPVQSAKLFAHIPSEPSSLDAKFAQLRARLEPHYQMIVNERNITTVLATSITETLKTIHNNTNNTPIEGGGWGKKFFMGFGAWTLVSAGCGLQAEARMSTSFSDNLNIGDGTDSGPGAANSGQNDDIKPGVDADADAYAKWTDDALTIGKCVIGLAAGVGFVSLLHLGNNKYQSNKSKKRVTDFGKTRPQNIVTLKPGNNKLIVKQRLGLLDLQEYKKFVDASDIAHDAEFPAILSPQSTVVHAYLPRSEAIPKYIKLPSIDVSNVNAELVGIATTPDTLYRTWFQMGNNVYVANSDPGLHFISYTPIPNEKYDNADTLIEYLRQPRQHSVFQVKTLQEVYP